VRVDDRVSLSVELVITFVHILSACLVKWSMADLQMLIVCQPLRAKR
jgi:hypothetical protein